MSDTNGRLQPILQYVLRKEAHRFGVQRIAAGDRNIDVVDDDLFGDEHGVPASNAMDSALSAKVQRRANFWGWQTPCAGMIHVVSLALMVAAIAIAADGEAR
jgi:hypothetical protein